MRGKPKSPSYAQHKRRGTIPIRAESVNLHREDWFLTLNWDAASKRAKEWGHKVYQIPNGAFVVRWGREVPKSQRHQWWR